MNEEVDNDMEEMPRELFEKALKKVTSKPGDKYKFIVKGGYTLIDAIYVLFCSVWKSEKIPEKWYNSELVQVWKG